VDYSANKAAEMRRYTSELERAREKKEAEEAQRQRKLEEKEAAKAKDPLQAFIALAKQRGYERPLVWAYQQLNMRELYKQGKMPKRKERK
jgi:beta-phosphoglucomutase-like phosphatase (HAD superfamily)